ncbi:MAG: enoyl-CoA hydratase/isomerase family protein [Pseudomonadota bacterium]|nr:enoyl-CoA hydratase/isomerase family protein [Pseudomonadota bacterium]
MQTSILQITAHPDVVVERAENGWAIVRLNRPKSLHALDESLALALFEVFDFLKQDLDTQAIWLDSTTPKAFCAGGDVRKLREMVTADQADQADRFFAAEYRLDLLLHQYAKPIVVWGEGYIMGGGMGLFMAAPFRLVTPSSRLAMPEINIGLFPDVGGSRFLAERGSIGLFLGLTGSVMSPSGAYTIGWATHICGLAREEVLKRLVSIIWSDYPAGVFRAIDDTLDALHRPLSSGPLQDSLDVIHSVCRGEDFMRDYQAIIALNDARSDWLRQAGENLKSGSPSTAALTWLLWQWGKTVRPWQEVFALEQELASWKIRHADFSEGVRARLVDKDLAPVWQAQQFGSLAEALGSRPNTSNRAWQDLLDHYGI